MPNFNKVLLMGNLTRDPEIKYTPKGTAVADFGLAINRVYTTDQGEKREETTFVDVTAWGAKAETLEKYVKKGDPLFVEGHLKLDTWDDKTTGQKRSRIRITLDEFQFLKPKGDGDEEPASKRPVEQRPPPARPTAPPRPPADPDLDADDDDIPF